MSYRGNMRRNNNPMPARGGGPLMTDHLQDLELELELLKRKRQLIQRQQSEMLYNNAPAGNMRYNQPSQSFNDRFNEPQHLNFSHLYNEAPQDNHSFGLKRRAQADWPTAPGGPNPMAGNKRPRQAPARRQNTQPFQNTQNFQRSKPNKQPQPLLNTSMPKPLMGFGPQGRRGPQPLMKPNQGPKPLTHHPNFKHSKPGPNRQNFIAQKPASPKKPTPNNNTTPKSAEKKRGQTFMPDQQLDNKLNGRLELALGMVVKEIKATYGGKPEYCKMFNLMPLARLMKQGIRERLHSAMTGKVIGTASDILAEYRQKFPVETDKDIVELAVVEEQKNFNKTELAIKLLEEGDPEQYFKKNMHRLLQARFDEMMAKLDKMVNEENRAVTKNMILQNLPDLKKTPDDVTATNTQQTKPAEETSVKAPEEVVNLDDETSDKTAENAEKVAEDTTKIAEDTAKVGEETAKVGEETAKVAEETALVGEETANKGEDTENVGEETANKGEETANKGEDTANVGEETANIAEGTEIADEAAMDLPVDFRAKAQHYDKWISFYIQRKLPRLLPNYRHMILKMFDLDHMYRNTKAAIITNTNYRAQARNISQAEIPNGNQSKDDPELPRNLPYFAKVLAIPAMPKRKIMQEFLNQYNPKTIKRHKKNYNLLFVGFDSKENYENILAANQTTVGNSTLSIVGNISKTTTIEIDDQNDNEIDKVLTPQLDDQIDDLLSSIRKADEDSKGNQSQVADVDLTTDASDEQEAKSDANANDSAANEATDATDAEKSEANNEAKDSQVAQSANGNMPDDECEVVEGNENNVVTIEDDEVAPLKSEEVKIPATPAKGRAPATPSSIRTRRSSRLVQ